MSVALERKAQGEPGAGDDDRQRDGAWIGRELAPAPDDDFVLKPRHSACLVTPPERLLQQLRRRHLLLAGVSAGQRVIATANDARLRDLAVSLPRDAVAAPTAARTAAALRHFEDVLQGPTTPVDEVPLPRREVHEVPATNDH